MGVVACFGASSVVHAAEDPGPERRVSVGVRAGLALPTQEIVDTTNTGLGHVLNFSGHLWAEPMDQYWLHAHMAAALRGRGKSEIGFSLPAHGDLIAPVRGISTGRWGEVQPYLSTGIGVNFNSASESEAVKRNNVTLSPNNTFAWRLAGGLDFAVTQNVLLNTEFAMDRNRGSIETKQGGTTSDSRFDATSMNILFGVRYLF